MLLHLLLNMFLLKRHLFEAEPRSSEQAIDLLGGLLPMVMRPIFPWPSKPVPVVRGPTF